MTTDQAPYYLQNPNAPNQTPAPAPEMTLAEAQLILYSLGWPAATVENMMPANAKALAQARTPPGGQAGQAPETIGSPTKGYMQWNADTQQWEAVPGPWGSEATGGGGAGPAPQWKEGVDPATGNMAFFDPRTGQTVVSPFPADATTSTISLSEGEVLYEKQPDGSYAAVAGGTPDAGWTYINRDDGIYGFNPSTGEVKQVASFPMSEADQQQLQLQRQQLALEAAQTGFPNIAYDIGGQHYQQVRPENQILAGETPHVAFQQRPLGAAAGTPFQAVSGPAQAATGATAPAPPAVGKTPVKIQAEVDALARTGGRAMTAERAEQIGTAFAQTPPGGGVFARLSGLAVAPTMTGPSVMDPFRGGGQAHHADIGQGEKRVLSSRHRANKIIPTWENAPKLPLASQVGAGTVPGQAAPPARQWGDLQAGLATAYKQPKYYPPHSLPGQLQAAEEQKRRKKQGASTGGATGARPMAVAK